MSVGDDRGIADAPAVQRTRRRILDRLFRSEAPGLRRFVRSRIGHDEEAQDVVQEAFVALAAARPQTLMERPEAYLQRVARNLVFNRYRLAAPERRGMHVDLEEALNVASPPEQEWAIEAGDATRRYIAVLDAMSPKTREIFLLNRIDALTYAEIAKRMHISVKAVEYHMGRALAQLHQAFYGQ